MPVVTTTVSKAKSFSWSYSRLNSFELCPRRYNETQVRKAWPEEKSDQLRWGDAVHEAMATALRKNKPLPDEFKDYQSWVDLVHSKKGELLVEDQCKWAIDRQFRPVEWFSPKAWLRCIADAVKIGGVEEEYTALAIDWKTGKSANADVLQLTLTSLMMFLQYPELLKVRAYFIWLPEDAHTEQMIEQHEASDQWLEILPRVRHLEQAVIDNNFPPVPGKFCRSWCPVKSCEFHGK